MTFVLRMAVREMRASWQRLLFFFICIAVGVAAIVALRSVIRSVRDVLGGEARSLIAADVLIATNRDWTPEARATIDRRLAEAGSTARTETIETPTMVRPADAARVATRMVELKAIQTPFPLYGTMTLEGGQPYSHALLENHGALVRPELLTALGVAVGDSLTIGEAAFTIRGVVASEPGRNIGAFSLGPRVFIDFDDVPSTGLLAFGSRVRHVLAARVPDDRIPALVKTLNDDFSGQLHQHAVVSGDRRRDRPRLRSGGELPEPGRPRDRHPRRHRGVERHAGLRAAEDPGHRRAQVPRAPRAGRSWPSTCCR